MWSPVYGVTPLSPFSRSAHVQAFVGSSDEKMSVASVLKFSGQGGSETSPYCPCAIVSTYFLKLNMEFNGYVDLSRTVSAPTTSRVRPVVFSNFPTHPTSRASGRWGSCRDDNEWFRSDVRALLPFTVCDVSWETAC